jgi:hypothetical protein
MLNGSERAVRRASICFNPGQQIEREFVMATGEFHLPYSCANHRVSVDYYGL